MRILVIEDNRDLCDAMCFQLRNEGYATDFCYTGEDALYYVLKQSYDGIILDRMLPVMDGLSILKTIRLRKINVPVIMVTAMDGLNDRVDGLDSGADDYLVKPFQMEELLARIRALLRRPPQIEEEEILRYCDIQLDLKKQSVVSGVQTCSLSRREMDLLEYFMRNRNQVLSRERIIAHVWGADTFVESGNLDNYIHFLRRRLKSVASVVQISTVYGVGYRLE
jgi:two-component system OmpR family response regulator